MEVEEKTSLFLGDIFFYRVNKLFETADNLMHLCNSGNYIYLKDYIASLKDLTIVLGFFIRDKLEEISNILNVVEKGEYNNKKLNSKQKLELLNFAYMLIHNELYQKEFFVKLSKTVTKEDIKKYFLNE